MPDQAEIVASAGVQPAVAAPHDDEGTLQDDAVQADDGKGRTVATVLEAIYEHVALYEAGTGRYTPALAAPLPRNGFDKDFFRHIEIRHPCRMHNLALKYCRDSIEMHQAEDGMLRCSIFKNSAHELGAIMVPHCEHDELSPIYKFQPGVDDQPWTWEEMVAHFDDESLDKVFSGVHSPQLRPGGRRIVACAIQEIAIGDHKRLNAIVEDRKKKSEDAGRKYKPSDWPPLPQWRVWDFVLHFDDGWKLHLHPSFKGTKVECKEFMPGEEHARDYEVPQGPRGGKGGTEGHGTFRRFASKAYRGKLRFDGKKSKGAGTASGGTAMPLPNA